MNKYLTKGRIALLVIFSVLIADQIIKIYVKTHMYWHQSENAIKWLYEKLGMVDAEPPTWFYICLLYTSPSPRDMRRSRMPSSA